MCKTSALPVPIYGPEFQTRACIISTDPERAFKDKVEDLKIPCVAEVAPLLFIFTNITL